MKTTIRIAALLVIVVTRGTTNAHGGTGPSRTAPDTPQRPSPPSPIAPKANTAPIRPTAATPSRAWATGYGDKYACHADQEGEAQQ